MVALIPHSGKKLHFGYLIIEITAVVLLLITGLGLMLYKLPEVSPTYDEGFSYLANGDYLIHNFRWDKPYILLHPPLSYYLHGWPSLVFSVPGFEEKILIARLAMLPIYIIFALLIYTIIRRWYGIFPAFVSLILYLFNPEILAHARLITPDHLLAFTIFITLVGFYLWLKKDTFWRVLFCGISLGLALLSKYNALLLLPLLLILGSIYTVKYEKPLKDLLVGYIAILLISFLCLHLGYLFKETGKLPDHFVSPLVQKITTLPVIKPVFQVIFPRAYLEGMDFQMYESSKGVWWGYFNGNYYLSGLWYFFPAVFAIKTPLPLLIMIILFILLLFSRKIKPQRFISPYLVISIIWFFVYFMFLNKLIIGLRYLMMVFPLLILLVVPAFNYSPAKRWLNILYKGLIVFLLIWYIWGIVSIRPFYLAYANEIIGGPKNLWKYVADSNLDWNQDQIFFNNYKKLHPELTAVNPIDPVAGMIAMNVNHINLYYYYQTQWLRDLHKEPVDEIGFTWLIFEVSKEDLAHNKK